MNPEPVSNKVLEEIKKQFKFLFNRGYTINYTNTINARYDVWEVGLKKHDFEVKFYEERGGLDLFFGSPSKGLVEIRSLIYFLSGEKDFVVSSLLGMKKYASLLEEHIDEFEQCFGNEHSKYEEGLKSAEKKYYDRRLSKTSKAITGSNKFSETSSILGIFFLSVLAYVLIIALLLPSSNNIGIISIVLAIPTTIFLRKQIKK